MKAWLFTVHEEVKVLVYGHTATKTSIEKQSYFKIAEGKGVLARYSININPLLKKCRYLL